MSKDQEYLDNFERENITFASFGKRAWAFTIDEVMVSVVMIAAFWNIIAATDDPQVIIDNLNQNIFFVILLKVSYHTFFTWFYGQTLGKKLLKIRVIDCNTLDNLPLLLALNRSVLRMLSEFLLYIGFFFYFLSPICQALHDKLSKAVVVNDS